MFLVDFIFISGYGMAGAGRRMRSNLRLRIASISKTITALGILSLCQDGLVTLDAKVFGSGGLWK